MANGPAPSEQSLVFCRVSIQQETTKGRCMVENAFGILKQTFRELLTKSDLDVAFLPYVILCCAILHNMLLGQSDEDVQNLLEVLRTEGLHGGVTDDGTGDGNGGDPIPVTAGTTAAIQKRGLLGMHLSMQRPQRNRLASVRDLKTKVSIQCVRLVKPGAGVNTHVPKTPKMRFLLILKYKCEYTFRVSAACWCLTCLMPAGV